MKFVVALLVVFVAFLALSQVQAQGNPFYTGQPGCQTEEEVSVGVYRHFRNKRAYWRCSVLGEPATLEFCPFLSGYLDEAKACVPWALWYWTPTVAPPSSPVAPTVAAEGSGQ
ncbi:uncharacterized protein [Musca autumnalis]|uniref:uncharacterized protein n=1 Tax=Musca autumnalis TaxID=221902 RepID=UPI003CEFD0F2